MAIGERIKYFRNLRGMTQKYLGQIIGFPVKTADVRMAQYETGTRTPKDELTNILAEALDVSPLALNVPDIDSYLGLMHTLFALEDLYGLSVENKDGGYYLRFDPALGKGAEMISEMVKAWCAIADSYRRGEISKEEYDQWRYRYPAHDQTQGFVKLPSKQLSDALQDNE